MKKALLAITLLTVATTSFTSCKKVYTCVCEDTFGVEREYDITASNTIKAADKCDEVGGIGQCTVK